MNCEGTWRLRTAWFKGHAQREVADVADSDQAETAGTRDEIPGGEHAIGSFHPELLRAAFDPNGPGIEQVAEKLQAEREAEWERFRQYMEQRWLDRQAEDSRLSVTGTFNAAAVGSLGRSSGPETLDESR